MDNRTIVSIIIIVLVTFSGITAYKIKNIPHDNSCINISCAGCDEKVECDSYNMIEKVRYVWNLY